MIIQNIETTTDMNTFKHLSERELEVLDLLSFGNSNKEIANQLYIGLETARTHRKSLIQKMNAKNSVDLIRICYEQSILQVSNTNQGEIKQLPAAQTAIIKLMAV